MATNVVVSVIVPSYNKVQYLLDCLLSIQRQTFTEFECIVVDDGWASPGTVREVVDRVADPRFRYVKNSHKQGPGGARNCGAEQARGEFIVFVDEDDELMPQCIEKLVGAARNANAAFVSPWAELFGDLTGVWCASAPTDRDTSPAMKVLGAGVLIDRKWWQIIGGYDESEAISGREDYEFWIRAAGSGGKFEIVKEAIYRYRRILTHQSLSVRTAAREAGVRRAIIRKNWDIFSKYGTYWRKFLAGGYKAEAVWDWSCGRRLSSIGKTICALFYYPSGKTARDTIKVFCVAIRYWVFKDKSATFA